MTQSDHVGINGEQTGFCNEQKFQFQDCLDKFISDELNCDLFWLNPTGKRECSTHEDLESFLQMTDDYFQKNEIQKKLRKAKCLPLSCSYSSWTRKTTFHVTNFENHKVQVLREFVKFREYLLVFYLPEQEVVKSTKVEMYNWNSFIADFGGYLGLLLGASILSIFEELVNFGKFLKEKWEKQRES